MFLDICGIEGVFSVGQKWKFGNRKFDGWYLDYLK